MEKEKLIGLIENDFQVAYDRIQSFRRVSKEEFEKIYNEYHCEKHSINKRDDKWIDIPDPNSTIVDENGNSPTIKFKVITAKLPISDQEIIVSRAAGFLCGNPVQLDCAPEGQVEENMLKVLQKTSDDNKMDYENKAICEKLFSEKEVAELWYPEPVSADYWKGTPNQGKLFRLRLKILCNSNGDTLYPVINKMGDMVAFGREYVQKDDDGKEDELHFEIYTDETFYHWIQKGNTGWGEPEKIVNILGKIPVIYHYKAKTEYQNVQPIINRREFSISHHGDINDYNGAPTRFVTGKILGWSKKAEAGAVIEGTPGSDIKILSWDHAPESIKLEQENLRSLIYDNSDTPDISFSQMKGLLGNVPQIGIKLLFLAAHMKASRNEEIYGKGVQRRINLWKAAMAKINISLEAALPMSVKPKFEYYLPKNDTEAINNIATGISAHVLSSETGTKLAGFTEDVEGELKRIADEQAAQQKALGLDNLMNA